MTREFRNVCIQQFKISVCKTIFLWSKHAIKERLSAENRSMRNITSHVKLEFDDVKQFVYLGVRETKKAQEEKDILM